MNNKLNVFFTIDKNYIVHFTVALSSLLENNKDLQINVFVIHDITDKEILKQINKFYTTKYKTDLIFLEIDSSLFNKYKISHHISKATYFRLLIADLIPVEIKSGLFIDSDVVVTGGLKDLTVLSFNKKSAEIENVNFFLYAAIEEYTSECYKILNEVGFTSNRYFNAGIMLLNLEAWRLKNVTQDLINYADNFKDKLLWWDQDILNLYFQDKWLILDSKYNSISITERLSLLPVIIHYNGSAKPWFYMNNHPYKDLYWKYIKLTPFKNQIPEGITFTNILRKYYRIFFKKN